MTPFLGLHGAIARRNESAYSVIGNPNQALVSKTCIDFVKLERMSSRRAFLATLAAGSMATHLAAEITRVRSVRSGPWSSPATWESNHVPTAGTMVEIQPGHTVVYDHRTEHPIRMVHVLGTLTFARDRNTRLDVGLLKIGGDSTEDGFNNTAHRHSGPLPALEVGTPGDPLPGAHTAIIRLVYFEGLDKDSFPALMCCGGRMDFHGAPLSRTWLKLGAPAKKGDTELTLSEPVTGWRPGDAIILTATTRQQKSQRTFLESTRDNTQTEERVIKTINGSKVVVDLPLAFDHICDGLYSGDVANLSRNVIIESADPEVARGHTMYHHGSAGAVSYAEFRHLGKRGVLGRYSLHFHLARDTMRGSSVIGASIWDSGNRWITIHGTDYMVVRDTIGYNCIGHGFFLEDGTEAFNVFDRNLAVQARKGKPLPEQVLPFDHNDGAGFWWANSRNTFTRNVACECDEYGFRFDAVKTAAFDPVLAVPQPDGSTRNVDIRTLAFVRFEDNESHCQRRHAFNLGGLDAALGGGCGGIGPDVHHPFIIRNMRVWNAHWAFHTLAPTVMLDNFDIHHVEYGLWRQNFGRHAYRGLRMGDISVEAVSLTTQGEKPEEGEFPGPLAPVDDFPPVTVVTYVGKPVNRKITVRGTTSDTGQVKQVEVNGRRARAIQANFAEWEVSLDAPVRDLLVRAEDSAGNAGLFHSQVKV
jgi:G8 domain